MRSWLQTKQAKISVTALCIVMVLAMAFFFQTEPTPRTDSANNHGASPSPTMQAGDSPDEERDVAASNDASPSPKEAGLVVETPEGELPPSTAPAHGEASPSQQNAASPTDDDAKSDPKNPSPSRDVEKSSSERTSDGESSNKRPSPKQSASQRRRDANPPNRTTATPSQSKASAKPPAVHNDADGNSNDVPSITPAQDSYQTEPIPEGKPEPVEPDDATKEDKTYHCTFSIRCDAIWDNIDLFDKNKMSVLPKDGTILATKTVAFQEGESVFDLLKQVTRDEKIHLEFNFTPIYNSAFIEGIHNLYPLDCGPLSGWEYKVNDWSPNYGCSRYQLQDGDAVEWLYTCDLGNDIQQSDAPQE